MRARYAEELRERLSLRNKRLVEALATVPREDFLGPGPWLVLRVPEGYTSTPDADPRQLYADVAVGLVPGQLLNNGAPSLVAVLIDALDVEAGSHVVHVGPATGYYSAILAEVVGPTGRVTAIELVPELADRARRSLARWKHVEVVTGDGTRHRTAPADVILVTAGCTHPKQVWLDGLLPGGRLLVPLTGLRPPPPAARFGRNLAGQALLVRRGGDTWPARFVIGMGISFCHGARDLVHERLLQQSFAKGAARNVRSLIRTPHPGEQTCWLHADDFCLSTREPRD